MRSIMTRAIALTATATAVVLAAPVSPANAHGEAAQESFLRMGTIAFINTEWTNEDGSPLAVEGIDNEAIAELASGTNFAVHGMAKVLDVWPQQLGQPEMGYISIVSPGPVVLVKERTINGRAVPHAFEIEKGGVYEYELKLTARRPGKWHIHPIFGVQEAGSLLGPGLFVDISGDMGDFKNELTLADGTKIDLENFQEGSLWFWNVIWAVLGMAWLLYWIVPKPTVTRLPINLQIPLNTDGEIYGLITKRDHRVSDAIMAITLVLTVGGMIYQQQAYPEKIPQQVLRFLVPAADVATFAEAQGDSATFDESSDTVTFDVTLTNTGTSPMSVVGFSATNYNWSADNPDHPLVVEGPSSIAPGETATVTLVMEDEVWSRERLMPLGESRLQITGVVIVEDAAGVQSYPTAQAFVTSSSIT